MNETLQHIGEVGILPIITLEDPMDAIPIGQAIFDGGLPNVVVTLRTDVGVDAIRFMSSALPQMVIGAGTVLSKEQVDEVLDAGASFITSPSINPDVVKYCEEKNIPVFPGVSTPSDIETALNLGLEYVEYFPAAANGGLKGLRSVSDPYPRVRFMPNGGVDDENMIEYLADPKIFAVCGHWFIDPEWITEKEYSKIEDSVRETVAKMHDFKLDHVAINFPKEEGALYAAEEFAQIFSYDVKTLLADGGYFAGTFFETMKPGSYGTHGHIAVNTNSVERAKLHLQNKGLTFDEDSAEYDEEGRLRAILLDKEIGGFGIQLIRKDAKKGRGELVYSGKHPHSLDLQIQENIDIFNLIESENL